MSFHNTTDTTTTYVDQHKINWITKPLLTFLFFTDQIFKYLLVFQLLLSFSAVPPEGLKVTFTK